MREEKILFPLYWWLAVQVNATIQQHGDLGVLRLVAQDRPDPIVFREDGRDDLQFAGFPVSLGFPQPARTPVSIISASSSAVIFFIDYMYLQIIIRT